MQITSKSIRPYDDCINSLLSTIVSVWLSTQVKEKRVILKTDSYYVIGSLAKFIQKKIDLELYQEEDLYLELLNEIGTLAANDDIKLYGSIQFLTRTLIKNILEKERFLQRW